MSKLLLNELSHAKNFTYTLHKPHVNISTLPQRRMRLLNNRTIHVPINIFNYKRITGFILRCLNVSYLFIKTNII